mgnify:CR=1 FL=1
MPRILSLAVLCLPCLASIASHGEDAVATTGKRRASASAIEWDVRDVNHPLLGPIKFAARRIAAATPVGNEKIVSQAYVSCQKSLGKIAVELSNAAESNPAGGLGPKDMPRLVCNRPGPRGGAVLVKSELAAKWEVNDLGDTLARGLSASDLRRCASIDVLQDVELPAGWPYGSQRVAMELLPYGKALDAVFKACGETTAVAPAARPPAAAVWKRARTIAKGRTNVRAAASANSPLVVKLRPGAALLAQRTSTDWWKVKPRAGAGFSGYIRQDRLVFE